MPELARWTNFYVIVGSAAGALIGLQFVVLTLVAQRPSPNVAEGGAAFGSPTIFHFSSVLFLSALLQAPWGSIFSVAVVWGVLGFVGVAYSLIVVRRVWSQSAYKPVFEDWLFHCVTPFIAYAGLAISAFEARQRAHHALFCVGAATLLLLFTGIHNAWDSVSYHVITRAEKIAERKRESGDT
ncbi:MAG TPA: hypothetical protein VGG14_20420 [Candidatus Sulfotelmatobacter sp.]|jgi:hypothetical protein